MTCADLPAARDRQRLLLELPTRQVRVPGLLRVPLLVRRRDAGPVVSPSSASTAASSTAPSAACRRVCGCRDSVFRTPSRGRERHWPTNHNRSAAGLFASVLLCAVPPPGDQRRVCTSMRRTREREGASVSCLPLRTNRKWGRAPDPSCCWVPVDRVAWLGGWREQVGLGCLPAAWLLLQEHVGVEVHVLLHERRDEVVAVVVALLRSQSDACQRPVPTRSHPQPQRGRKGGPTCMRTVAVWFTLSAAA